MWWPIFFGLFGLMFLLRLFFFWRLSRRRGRWGNYRLTPEELLKRRLASGEITEAEYERLKAVLQR